MDINIIITLIVAVITCLFGFRLNKVLIALAGFVLGMGLCNAVCMPLISNETTVLVLSIVVGLLLSLVAFRLYLVGIFLACFFLVYTACNIYIEADTVKQIVGAVAGLFVGVLGVKFTRPIMIISTSFSGAFVIVDTVFGLINFNIPIMSLIIGIIIGVISASYQFRTNPEKD